MTATTYFAPLNVKKGEAIALAMERLWLSGKILPAGARLTVQHVFRSAETEPIQVIYSFPLPRDAALRRFRIVGEGFEVHSELRDTDEAVKVYEEGLAQGSLAGLARQYGDGLINLTVGNIRPGEQVQVYLEIVAGVELRDDGFRFRFPFTLAPAYHPCARTAVIDGEGEMELPQDEFGDVVLPRFRENASALHQVGFELSVASELEIDEVGSPSHAIRVHRESAGVSRTSLGAEKDIPNRDLVLDCRYRETRPQVLAGTAGDGKRHFAAIVPSSSFGNRSDSPRRVVILLDRSGSMEGAPLEQASKAIDACLAALSETDSFGLVAFDNQVEVCGSGLLAGTRENRDSAHRFLQDIGARGGTELVLGFQKAVEILERGGGDVLILTDGQVSGTEGILAEARLTNTRLHCLGIGSASQDRFLALLARETGGVSRFVTPSERVDLPAVDLFASIGRPLAAGLKAKGAIEPQPPGFVFAGTPVLLFGEAGETNAIELEWDGGSLTLPVEPGETAYGETVWLLQGARLITDWESRYPSTEALAPLGKRQQNRVAMRLREFSKQYGLASREMALVAVVKRADDRPGQLPVTRVVPVGMPQDVNFKAYFAPSATGAHAVFAPMQAAGSPMYRASASAPVVPVPPPMPAPGGGKFRFSLFGLGHREAEPVPAQADSLEDTLLLLASSLESDGGMPGKGKEARVSATVAALFAFLSNGYTAASGAFRSHVARMVAFLESVSGLDADKQSLVDRALKAARQGQAPKGEWLRVAQSEGDSWQAIVEALG